MCFIEVRIIESLQQQLAYLVKKALRLLCIPQTLSRSLHRRDHGIATCGIQTCIRRSSPDS